MTMFVENSKPIRAAATYIRMSVFVLERGIALSDEFDDKDSEIMIYAVLFEGKQPVATCRFENPEPGTLKIGRVATLKAYRGHGYGRQVITAMETRAKKMGMSHSLIHSELTAQGFYERMGYHVVSDTFMEDGVPCVVVKKKL
ncbi:GNAT family N-acetyltransferase [Lentilactobacillus kisonensis]|uniref:Acetyltransferase, GNAT family n=1 Tax=Lentilactobacillus kisonensis F0435 TaxID=797516 RepID=H1LD11_9LACO|nr:GNAT family N-acetyltransferase [Lentilactobacillus kisonensis]EHO53619.1 acetyltransferase, GNAT family [Lentilactobacillus kisonensis F0435]